MAKEQNVKAGQSSSVKAVRSWRTIRDQFKTKTKMRERALINADSVKAVKCIVKNLISSPLNLISTNRTAFQ